MRGVRLQWAVLIAQGGSRGRAGSSWFLSLRLRLAINVFSCIFSNGVMRNAPVSHKLMCRWSYPFIYIPHRRSPPVTLIRTCLSNKAAGISSHLQTETGHRSCPPLPPGGVTKTDIETVLSLPLEAWRRRASKLSPSLLPGGVTERTACKGDRLVTAGWL